ncbi:carbohydrate binding domain cbm49 protein [Acanthamoeba castellanii str. Neff]|uniref:Carbohydrate binding domain cbm49 protein n=1 Tax=Acanthamoeba castellanii (strain ATCC 30010 / Neff) TaxID=1257118 RepID=L8GT02_ACACF|nr:carbohydrate binding domain cbm49 protein [Acanthamoeba castellanii str. Neff]ELR15733.1 carbohydrate binding domain cbm49 protein [Acanthamoeba castellanii str. Neff]
MRVSYACVFLLLALACSSALGACVKPTISQSRQTSWTDGLGVTYSVWSASIATGSNTISSLILSIDPAANSAPIDNIWELVPKPGNPSLYELPQWRQQNGGIAAGQSHNFGYTIRSAQAAPFQVSSWNCPGEANPSASASPSSQPSNPSASPSSQPSPSQPPQNTGAVCQSVLVVDNWVRRNLPGMTLEQIAQKYALYWADINKFYDIHFGINLNLTYVHVEDGSSFTETLDGQELLDSFTNGLRAGVFAGVPSGACLYHLITGRNPYGVGGLAWVNAACASNFGATGFSVDGQGDDEGNSVIGFAIHEIGHNLGGNHPDAYPASAGYTCSTNEDHQYLNPLNFISDCATQSIKSALPAFSCMWSLEANSRVSPQAIFCNEENAEGDCLTVAAHYGTEQCYNILPFNDAASSFQLFAGTTGAVGLQLFYDLDCFGNSVEVRQFYAPSMPAGFNNQVTSFKFIMQ